MTISAKTRLVRTTSEFLFIFSALLMSSSGIIALDSRKSKEINLYSDYTENKLQALTFAAITSIWISLHSWDLAYNDLPWIGRSTTV